MTHETALAGMIGTIVGSRWKDQDFWRFAGGFADGLGLDFEMAGPSKVVLFLEEAERQFAYLLSEHPAYLAKLTGAKDAKLSPTGVMKRVVAAVPMEYLAAFRGEIGGLSEILDRLSSGGIETLSAGELPTGRYARAGAASEKEKGVAPDGGEEAGQMTAQALSERALGEHRRRLWKIVRVKEYAVGGEYFSGGSQSGGGSSWELAQVIGTSQTDLCVTENDEEGRPWVRGTWSIRLLSGEHAGSEGFVIAPTFYDDGTHSCDAIMLDGPQDFRNISYAPLSDVDATPEEMLMYRDLTHMRAAAQLAVMQKYALSGLATEMTMHEANGLLSHLRSAAGTLMAERPDDPVSRTVSYAARRLQDDFDFLSRFKASSGGGYNHTPQKIVEAVQQEFSHAIRSGNLVLAPTDAFLKARIDAVMINLVRNSLYWGSGTSENPVVVRFDAEEAQYERTTWDDETETEGVEVATADVVVVSDNGPGLPPGTGDEIFEVGVSGRRSSGIGLYICRTGLEASGCTIVVADEQPQNGGATFRIGKRQILRPDYDPRQPRAEKPLEAELADAVSAMEDLVANGDFVEAGRFVGVYEEAAGRALRIRLRGAEGELEARLVAAVDMFHAALSAAPGNEPVADAGHANVRHRF